MRRTSRLFLSLSINLLKLEDQSDVATFLCIHLGSSHVDGCQQFKLSKPQLIQKIILGWSLTKKIKEYLEYVCYNSSEGPIRPIALPSTQVPGLSTLMLRYF
jgi:hypothetical protein